MSLLKVKELWRDIDQQNWENLSRYFAPKATIAWPNTNEVFTVDGFVKANSAYPGKWDTELQNIEVSGDTFISVTKVSLAGEELSFYAISFFEFEDGLIVQMSEYWSENGEAPAWRADLGINKNL